MKVTNAEIIKDGEQDLIDAINGDLDWGTLEKIFKKDHGLGIGEDVAYKEGDIVVHNGQVAYRLEFEVKVTMAVLVDRQGRYIEMAVADDPADDRSPNEYDEALDAITEAENKAADASETDPDPDGKSADAIEAAATLADEAQKE
jgi:hypothetical protein